MIVVVGQTVQRSGDSGHRPFTGRVVRVSKSFVWIKLFHALKRGRWKHPGEIVMEHRPSMRPICSECYRRNVSLPEAAVLGRRLGPVCAERVRGYKRQSRRRSLRPVS
jgi:hypothetical protein